MFNQVFLGGTCNGSKWRDTLIPYLTVRNISYFNPVVDNWTEQAQEVELDQRKNCDFCLYTITPKMTNVYSIAEVVDDSNKRPEKTILCLLREDKESRFTDSQWKSLIAVANMVESNGSLVCATLEQAADFITWK